LRHTNSSVQREIQYTTRILTSEEAFTEKQIQMTCKWGKQKSELLPSLQVPFEVSVRCGAKSKTTKFKEQTLTMIEFEMFTPAHPHKCAFDSIFRCPSQSVTAQPHTSLCDEPFQSCPAWSSESWPDNQC